VETTAEAIQQVRAQATAAQAREEAARRQLAEARRWRAFWQDLLAQLDAGRPAGALLLLRREEQALRCQGDEAVPAATLDAVIALAEQQARAGAARFQHAFPAAVSTAGLALDDTSRYPRYTLRDGFVHVDVEEQSLTARVRPRDGSEIQLGMDVGSLLEAIRRETGRLFDRPLDHAAFLRRLWLAYRALLEEDGRVAGEALPLRRLLARLNREAPALAPDEFNVDLARLVRSDQTVIEGQRLQLHHTRRTRQGMLLSGLEQGGYVGFLSFEPEATGW
jgi:hypothetical protein